MQRPYEPPLDAVRDPLQPTAGDAAPVHVLGAVRFVFTAADWKTNLALGVVFSLIPVVGPLALSGWLCEVHQRLARGSPLPIPKLDFADLAHYLVRGVVPFLVKLVVLTPLWLLVGAGYVVTALGVVTAVHSTGEPWVGVLIVTGGVLCASIMSLLTALVLHAAQTRAELTESFTEALAPGALLRFIRSTWPLVLVKGFLFSVVSGGLLVGGLALLCIGVYPAAVVIQVAATHLRWQIYRHHVDRGGEPIAIREPQVLPSDAVRQPFRSYSGY